MSGDNISINLEEREVVGKGLNKLVEEGKVPAVIHNHGKESIHVMGDSIALIKAYGEAGKHHPVNLKVAGKQHLALIKDIDVDPAKRRLRHVVFQAIRQNEETEAEIPVVFSDVEIPAERKSLMVLKQLDTVQVKALPRDLPDQLIVDPSSLQEAGDTLTVADLKIPAGVTLLTAEDQQIASVEVPRDQVAEANAIAEEQAADAGTTEEPGEATEDAETAESADSTEE